MRVLVVDDHHNTRLSLAMGLSLLGHQADAAANADEAARRLAAGGYDWMVCDIRMPRVTGLELAVTARALDPRLGIILITAYDVSDDERPIIEAIGATLRLKPITAASLSDLCQPRAHTTTMQGKGARG